jgi:hypothetical protein
VPVEVLELDSRPRRRSRAASTLATLLVLAGVLTGFLLLQRHRAQLFTAEEVRQALAASYPDRTAPFGRGAPPAENARPAPVTPASCSTLLLRPWLVDAWPRGAVSGSETGAPGLDSYPGSEAFAFTTRSTAEARRLFEGSRSALVTHACDRVSVRPAARGRAPFTVAVQQQAPEGTAEGGCSLLSYSATASPPQPGSPESVTTELLQVGNTVSLLVQLSEDDVLIFAGSYLEKDAGRPTLTTLCRELQRSRAA